MKEAPQICTGYTFISCKNTNNLQCQKADQRLLRDGSGKGNNGYIYYYVGHGDGFTSINISKLIQLIVNMCNLFYNKSIISQ